MTALAEKMIPVLLNDYAEENQMCHGPWTQILTPGRFINQPPHRSRMSTRSGLLVRYLLVSLLTLASLSGGTAQAQDFKRGKKLYALCSVCHGPGGHGKLAQKAPALAGLTDWYLVDQLQKFRNDKRGKHHLDVTGMMMRPMAKTLTSDKDVEAVAAYIAGLSPKAPTVTFKDTDPEKGKTLYNVCIACHGDKVQGNEELKTPPLRHLDDWYQLAQLKKFKAGMRGADPTDAQSAQMRAILAAVPDEQAMKDIIAYQHLVANGGAAEEKGKP